MKRVFVPKQSHVSLRQRVVWPKRTQASNGLGIVVLFGVSNLATWWAVLLGSGIEQEFGPPTKTLLVGRLGEGKRMVCE
jgi:hypothetical protein